MNRFTLFITLLLASIGIGWAQSSYIPVADLQMSTSEGYHFYKIASPRGGFLTLNSDGDLKHIATDLENSYWIVESAGNAANDVYPVYLRNATTLQYFKFGPAVSYDKSIVYLKATTWAGNSNFPAAQGTVISPNNAGGGNCLDANNTSDNGVGTWGTINDGNSWYFAEVSDDEIASIPTNLKSYLGKNSASIGSSLKTPYLTTIGYAKACTVLFDDTNTTTAETAINSIDDFSTSENSFSNIVSAFDNYRQNLLPTEAQNALNALYTTANGKVVALNSVASSNVRMASPAEGSVAKGESTTNYNTVWQILTNNSGQLALKNLATGQYIQQAGSYGNDQEVNQTTSPDGALYYNLILNNQANVVIFNVPNNGNMCIHQGTDNGICYWGQAAGGARWLVSDQSEVAEDAAMLTNYSNQLAAMNDFPAGTFNTEGISIAEITAATPIADITSAASTVPAAMATAAASADGKVIAFRNTEKAAYIGSPAVADGTLQKVTDQSAPTPATAWMLHHGEGTEFTLSNVLTGFYVGIHTGSNTSTGVSVPVTTTADNAETITFVHHSNSNGTGILLETGHHQNPENTAQSKIVSADSGIKIWGPAPAGARWAAEAVTVPTAVTVAPEALTLTIGETPANNTLTAALTGENITAGFDALEWTAGEGLTLAEVADQPLQRTVTLANNAAAGTAKVTVASTLKGLNLDPAEATVTINAASPLLPLVSTEGNEHYYAIKAIRNTSQNGTNQPGDFTGSYIRPTNDETALTRQNAIDDYAVMIFETAEGVEVPAGFSMAVKIKNIKTGKYFGGTISGNQLNLTDAAGATTWYLTTGAASVNGTDYEGVMMANLDQSDNKYLESGDHAKLSYWQPNTVGSLWIMEPETIPSGVAIALGKQELLTSTEVQTVTVTPTWTPDNLNDAFKTLTYAVTTGEGDTKAEAAGFTVADGNLTVPANAAAGTYTVTATTFNHIEATATLTINDRVLDVTEIALDAAASAGITDGTVTLGAQTGTATWTATDVTLAFTVKVSASSKTPEASEFTVTSNNAAVAIAETDAVAITGPDADGAYTLTVKATATAPTAADAPAVLSIAYSGAHSPFTQTITVAKPTVNVTEVVASPATATVNLTKTADGTIGASAEQTATFVITTDGPTNKPEFSRNVKATTGITVKRMSDFTLTNPTNGVGTEFEVTVTYIAEATAPASGTVTLDIRKGNETVQSATLDITVITPVTGISAEAATSTIILGENGEATTTISGTISPEAANFTADQISATANKTEGMAFGNVTTGTANSFTIPVTATKAGTYQVTVAYKNGDETISAPVIITVTAPAPEEGITVEAPTETLPESVAVEVAKPVAGEAQAVAIAFNNPEEQCRIELPVADEGVNIRTFYEIEYAANNPNGESIEAYLMTTNDGASSVILTNKEGTAVPFNTVIKVVEKNVVSRAAGDAVIVINASINAAEIESVTLNGGRPIEVYLNQTLTLTAATEPASDNEVTYTVTDSKGNVVEPTAPGQYVFTVAGTYTVTATVAGTVPAVTTTTVIRAINATGNPGQGVSGIEAVNADAAEGRATIYDLAGRRLTRINAAGIYIVNGVKTLVR